MGIGIVQRVVEHQHNCPLHHVVNRGRARAANLERTRAVWVGDRQTGHCVARRLFQIVGERRVACGVMEPHHDLEQPGDLRRPRINPAPDLARLVGRLGLQQAALGCHHMRFELRVLQHAHLVEHGLSATRLAKAQQRVLQALSPALPTLHQQPACCQHQEQAVQQQRAEQNLPAYHLDKES